MSRRWRCCGGLCRYFGAAAGLLAGLVLALTPVAVLMFRFDNPDALLVLLMIAAVWATCAASRTGAPVDGAHRRVRRVRVPHQAVAGDARRAAVGADIPDRRATEARQAGPAVVRGSRRADRLGGWWLLTVELWPADSRPWIGGSQNNSILELTLGYNGFGRLSGNERAASGVAGRAAGSPWRHRARRRCGRRHVGEHGDHAIVRAGAGWSDRVAAAGGTDPARGRDRAVWAGSANRPRRASFVVWGSWLVVTGLVFSFMAASSTRTTPVALAPAVAALIGAGAVTLWRGRRRWWVRIVAFAAIAVTASTAWILLARSPDSSVAAVGGRGGRRRRGLLDGGAARSADAGRRRRDRGDALHGSRRAGRIRGEHDRHGPYRIDPVGRAARRGRDGSRRSGRHAGSGGAAERRSDTRWPGNGEGAFEMPVVPGGFGGAGGGLLDAGEPATNSQPCCGSERTTTPGWLRRSVPTAQRATSWRPSAR